MWRIQVGHWNHGGPVSHAHKEVSAIGKTTTAEHVTHDMAGCGTKFIAIGIQIIPLLLLVLFLFLLWLLPPRLLLRMLRVLLWWLWPLLWPLLWVICLHAIATRVARKRCVRQLEMLTSRHSLCGDLWCHCENQTFSRRPLAVVAKAVTALVLHVVHHMVFAAIWHMVLGVWTSVVGHVGKPILVVAHHTIHTIHTISPTIPLLRIVRMAKASGTLRQLPSSG